MSTSLRPGIKTRFFGVFALESRKDGQGYTLRVVWPRLFLLGGVTLCLAYAVFVGAGYYWLHNLRKIDRIGVADVALLRWQDVRRAIAVDQFAQGQRDWDAKDYQKAYISYSSALRNDPDNVTGRLQTVHFLEAVGASNMALSALEAGLDRSSANEALVEETLQLLTSSGRDARALEVIRGRSAAEGSSLQATFRIYEVLATLNLQGPQAANQLLEKYASLEKNPKAGYTVARVQWESQRRLDAIKTLAAAVDAQPKNFAGYGLLLDYEQMAGLDADARHTAERAVAQLPELLQARLLMLATLDPLRPDERSLWEEQVKGYFQSFGERPEAIVRLADLAGRKGWVSFVRYLYEVGACRLKDHRMMALYLSDALMRTQNYPEAAQILKDVEGQAGDDVSFLLLLWQRQVVVAAALGNDEDARDKARRLAAALSHEPAELEMLRRRFTKMGIAAAVSELKQGQVAGQDGARKKT